jgi:tRNA uridine 5-carboxymethylaminomethyl modification enzyme
MCAKQDAVGQIKKTLEEISVEPGLMNDFLQRVNSSPLSQKQKLSQVLLRPGISLSDLCQSIPSINERFKHYSVESIEQAEIQVKYHVYLEKEKELVQRFGEMENLEIPSSFDYRTVQAISTEAREKLSVFRPRTLGQASRISGINPSDIQILMVFMGR